MTRRIAHIFKANKYRGFSARVLFVDANCAVHKDTFFTRGICVPVIRLTKYHDKAGRNSSVIFNLCQIVKIPCFANLESTVGILLGFMYSHTTGLANRYDNCSFFLSPGGASGGEPRRRVTAILNRF